MIRALAIVVAFASVARAGTRVVMLTDQQAMPAALAAALADRHVELSTLPPPEGALALDRAAAVEHAAIASNADAGVWLDAGTVWAVSSDGRFVRHAAVPANATPTAVASIANSLLGEMWPPQVHVTVTITPPAPVVAVAARPVIVPPIDPAEDHATRTLVELGMTASPATFGLEAEIALPLSRHVRLGAFGGINQLFDGIGDYDSGTQLYDAGGELRYVGSGTIHVDVGVAAGLVHGAANRDFESDTGGMASLRLGLAYELPSGVLEAALAPTVLIDTLGHDEIAALMGSLRWGLPL